MPRNQISLRIFPYSAGFCLVVTTDTRHNPGGGITVTPPQAGVYIDGDALGQAPLCLKLTPAVYTIEVAKDGFRTFKKTITIAGKDLFIRLTSTTSRLISIEQVKTGRRPKDVLFSPRLSIPELSIESKQSGCYSFPKLQDNLSNPVRRNPVLFRQLWVRHAI